MLDWVTIVAQAVNFLILVALLKRFLYGPLLRAIDSREARIAECLAEAARKKEDAQSIDARAQAEIARLEADRAHAMEDARQDAERRRHELIESARESVRAMEARWREDLEREKNAFLVDLRRAAAGEILAIARRAVADLASADLEASAILAFLEKFGSLDAFSQQKLQGEPLTVVTSNTLGSGTRTQIEEAIRGRLGADAPIAFERDPKLAWGIELRAAGQRIGWTPGAYLDSVEEKLRAVIEECTEAGSSLAA
jgi:F-type H+-transporting ATPase subunit b